MYFQKIVEAGMKQDSEALNNVLKTSGIDVFKIGSFCFSAVSQFAMEENFKAMEFLITHGANINLAAQGAAIGGHKETMETLLARGANINNAVRGAAIGGHKETMEALLTRGANINYAVQGAAIGGHKEAMEALLARGASIHRAVEGAAIVGHTESMEALLARGADINNAVRGAAIGEHKETMEALLARGASIHRAVEGAAVGGHKETIEALLTRGADINIAAQAAMSGHILEEPTQQIAFLSFYQPETIAAFTKAFKARQKPVVIDESTEKRAIAISKNIHQGIVNYSQALTRTDPQCQGMLYLLMAITMKHQAQLPHTVTSMPLDLWCYIFNFITPAPLDKKDFEGLGFVIGRSYLCAQLSTYESGWGNHKERAHSFFQEAISMNNKERLRDLVTKQTQVLQGSNPYSLIERDKKHKSNVSNASLDKYHGIIGFWEEMLTGTTVDFEDRQEICTIQ